MLPLPRKWRASWVLEESGEVHIGTQESYEGSVLR